jgi:hypothetical protein
LADELGTTLRTRGFEVLRPSVDGFHHPRERRYRQGEYSAAGYYQDAFNYQAVAHALLEPLSGDTFPVECRQVDFDYRTDIPVDAPPVGGAWSFVRFRSRRLQREPAQQRKLIGDLDITASEGRRF